MRRICIMMLALCTMGLAQAQVGVYRSSGAYGVSKKMPDLGPLTKNGKVYYYHNTPMTETEMVAFIQQNCDKAYQYYKKQQKIENAGWGVFGGGAAICLGLGLGLTLGGQLVPPYDQRMVASGISFICIGTVSTVLVGIPMIIAGNVQKKNTHKVFNTWCGYKELETSQLELKLTSGENGIGLALAF